MTLIRLQQSGIGRRNNRPKQLASSDLQTTEKERCYFRTLQTFKEPNRKNAHTSPRSNHTCVLLRRRHPRHKGRCTGIASQAPRAHFLLSAMTGEGLLKVWLTRMESQFTIRRKHSKGMWFCFVTYTHVRQAYVVIENFQYEILM